MANLRAARAHLEQMPGVCAPLLASAVYETEPIECEPGAEQFLNAVLEVGYSGEARELFGRLREIERLCGRSSLHQRNVSRTLDLDLLYFDGLTMKTSALELPHPRMHTRRFVLEPLAEIRPYLSLPGQQENVAVLLAQLSDTTPLVRFASEW